MKVKRVANAIAFQVTWFLCILANDYIALIAVCSLFLFHYFFIVKQSREWWLILAFSTAGIVLDSVLQTTKIIQFNGAIELTSSLSIVPIWMMCLWIGFATSLAHALSWFHQNLKTAAFAGATIVPINYYVGLSLSNSSAVEPLWFALLCIGVSWSILLPVGLFYAKRLE